MVFAIEHGDGSACFTERGEDVQLLYEHPGARNMNSGETELEFRKAQLETRKNEVFEAIDIMKQLNLGDYKNVLSDHSKLDQFKNRFDFDNMVMFGHSFGAATSIHVLNQPNPFKCSVVFQYFN